MKKNILILALFLSSCVVAEQKPIIVEQEVVAEKVAEKKDEFSNQVSIIELQNPDTRDVVYCMKDESRTAEECAEIFESFGFIKTRNIPYKTAKYDLLQTDTYPTRRWRNGERTPRW